MNLWVLGWLSSMYRRFRQWKARMCNGLAGNDLAWARAGECAWCSHLRIYENPAKGGADGYCGRPKILRAPEETPELCGCVVLTISSGDMARARAGENGDRERTNRAMLALATPDGKTTIEGERCPQGKW